MAPPVKVGMKRSRSPKQTLFRLRTGLPGAVLLLGLAGCSTGNPHLYHWGEYPKATYAYLRGDRATPEEQLEALKKTLAVAGEKGWRVPPGLHAQLGLLYAQKGDSDLAREHWETEKALFPASEEYMDFVLQTHQP